MLKFLRSTPSSVNVQPNHFYVLATPEGKKRLADNLGERFQDNVEEILNASHTIILTTRVDLPDSHLEAVFTKERADGRFPDVSKQELWESMSLFSVATDRVMTLVPATDRAPVPLGEVFEVSTCRSRSPVGSLSCRTRPASCAGRVGQDACRHP
ncbi:nitroreductase family protein [Streptomyces sp. MC1]|uniref:nitroreductase family protein n=1 Tax=Streptomyces sp. MC1 TaxID=295105 RepID=UPI0022AC377A|nr:nitroreductase family protein [Streptomyces sp. MC1]